MDVNRFKLTDYAINILLVLAQSNTELMNVKTISEISTLSRATINKILFYLLKDGIVLSTKGKLGGYKLARLPDEIKLTEITNSIHQSDCEEEEKRCCQECKIGQKCTVKNTLSKIHQEVRVVLDKFSLKDFL